MPDTEKTFGNQNLETGQADLPAIKPEEYKFFAPLLETVNES
jgi:hypothetical protein